MGGDRQCCPRVWPRLLRAVQGAGSAVDQGEGGAPRTLPTVFLGVCVAVLGADTPLALHLAIHALRCAVAATTAAADIALPATPLLALCNLLCTGVRGAAAGHSACLPAAIPLCVLVSQALRNSKHDAYNRTATYTVQAGPLLYLRVMRVCGAELPRAVSGAVHAAVFTPCCTEAYGV